MPRIDNAQQPFSVRSYLEEKRVEEVAALPYSFRQLGLNPSAGVNKREIQ